MESVRDRKTKERKERVFELFHRKNTFYKKPVMQLKVLAKCPRGSLTCLSNRRLL